MNKLQTIQQELQKTKHLNDKLKAEGVLEVGKPIKYGINRTP